MGKISATILTYNEEKRIEPCLESLRGIADEIIVIDSFSTDSTVDICKRYGCKVTQRRLAGYGAQRQYATSLTSHSYVLSIDADEVLSPALRTSLLRLKEEGFNHRVYAFSRLNFYCGQPVKHCGWYPDTQIRLFDKRYANWNLHDVAEKVIFRDSVAPEHVDGDILHYRCDTPAEYSETLTNHAGIRAKVIATQRRRVGRLRPLLAGAGEFMRCYIKEGGILDGTIGRDIAREQFRSTLLAYKAARKYLKSKQKP